MGRRFCRHDIAGLLDCPIVTAREHLLGVFGRNDIFPLIADASVVAAFDCEKGFVSGDAYAYGSVGVDAEISLSDFFSVYCLEFVRIASDEKFTFYFFSHVFENIVQNYN